MTRTVRTGLAAVVLTVALGATQALAAAATPTRFGAKLTTDTQPQPALWCDDPNDTAPHPDCTWILDEALGRANGGHRAPRNGIISKVRLMSCRPGRLRVQVARQVPGTSRYQVVSNGPTLSYQGDRQGCGEDDDFVYRIETFSTSFSVRRGDRIAIRAKKTGLLRCGGGGDATLLFRPPLAPGGAARKANDTQGCLLLMEWQYR